MCIALKMCEYTRAKVSYNWLIVMFCECLRVSPAARFKDFLQCEAGMGGIGCGCRSPTVAGEHCLSLPLEEQTCTTGLL